MLTLYGRNTSDSVQKVLWVLGETDQSFDHVPLGGSYGGLDDPHFAAMNPHRRVPTLKDGDTVVWESDAIIRYIAAKYSYGMLWPVSVSDRARADQWMAWTLAHLYDDSNLPVLAHRAYARSRRRMRNASNECTSDSLPSTECSTSTCRLTSSSRCSSDDGGHTARLDAPITTSICPSNENPSPHLERWYALLLREGTLS